ncbi:MAG: hypothetical protein BWX88_02526 [Planctomycetes bacterium ADurb.Bin126]|nr:MAG: hypothetical protein BWX88_02526 [Planctomycetes bacterium ADurb.Bin126]HOD81119.1 hypothetical protein [Phycisphaerae bacterium]HQL72642.1 hypothetical protein [Phycisphaerae bacterium]
MNDILAKLDALPSLRVMDVEYVHVAMDNGDDLYVTALGLPWLAQLLPGNYWTDAAWFAAHNQRLSGTSTLYRIQTKPVGGRPRDIVLKWNRMGQDIPGETQVHELEGAEFNSPFEEFALVFELRRAARRSSQPVRTHKPLAIYVPAGHVEMDRLGRKAYKFDAKLDSHTEIELHANRNYAVIYEWIKGLDALQAIRQGLLTKEDLPALIARADDEMRRAGFRVRDSKAQHIILRRSAAGDLARDRGGQALYATVDFELLERTPEHEAARRAAKRQAYLIRQARRFEASEEMPPNLKLVNVMGVDYVYGRTDSTSGALWVVGRDPSLFDYFLPENWRRTPRTKLSVINQIYDTRTKDNVHLVWKVCRVGEQPDMDPFKPDEKRILEYGYNSPFEEIALNQELARKGIAVTYPRAIYMTGSRSRMSETLSDPSRYRSHAHLLMPDGLPVLRPGHDYMLIWGYWNGPDELLAEKDEEYYVSLSALQAYRQGVISEQDYLRIVEVSRSRLHSVGVEDLNLRGNHLLLALDAHDHLLLDEAGLPQIRICSFELLRRTTAKPIY